MSMKKIIKYILILLFLFVCLTGCSKGNIEDIDKNLKKIELTSNLVTYKAYYHNVIEYKKDKGTRLSTFFCFLIMPNANSVDTMTLPELA